MSLITIALATSLLGLQGQPAAPPLQVTRVRFMPAPGQAAAMKGGRFTGSNSSATNDFETLAEIKEAPKEGEWTELPVEGRPIFRFLKYEGTWNTGAAIAEVEFYAGSRKLTGNPFSTVPADGKEARLAFDGNVQTVYQGKEVNGQYVGFDLGPESQVAAPTVSVLSGVYSQPIKVRLTTLTPGAVIRYTRDQGTPSADWGEEYKGEITVDKGTVIVARAFRPDLAGSSTTFAAYRIGVPDPKTKAVTTFHIGNSLTDTVVPWMEPLAAAAGRQIRFHRFTIPGAPTDWLWEHPGSGFGDSRYEQAFFARAPIDHIFTQPFAGHGRSIENEADHSQRFYEAARRHSPDIQAWLYVQWPTAKLDDSWSKGEGAVKGLPGIKAPATTFAEAISNFMVYARTVRDRINASYKGKPVKIVPAGPALVELKRQIDAGKVPGMTDLFKDAFSDDLHLNSKGAYLVSLVHYASIFNESPEGKVGPLTSGLTPEQARILQRIAWEVVRRK
jgi:hypothetical protein